MKTKSHNQNANHQVKEIYFMFLSRAIDSSVCLVLVLLLIVSIVCCDPTVAEKVHQLNPSNDPVMIVRSSNLATRGAKYRHNATSPSSASLLSQMQENFRKNQLRKQSKLKLTHSVGRTLYASLMQILDSQLGHIYNKTGINNNYLKRNDEIHFDDPIETESTTSQESKHAMENDHLKSITNPIKEDRVKRFGSDTISMSKDASSHITRPVQIREDNDRDNFQQTKFKPVMNQSRVPFTWDARTKSAKLQDNDQYDAILHSVPPNTVRFTSKDAQLRPFEPIYHVTTTMHPALISDIHRSTYGDYVYNNNNYHSDDGATQSHNQKLIFNQPMEQIDSTAPMPFASELVDSNQDLVEMAEVDRDLQRNQQHQQQLTSKRPLMHYNTRYQTTPRISRASSLMATTTRRSTTRPATWSPGHKQTTLRPYKYSNNNLRYADHITSSSSSNTYNDNTNDNIGVSNTNNGKDDFVSNNEDDELETPTPSSQSPLPSGINNDDFDNHYIIPGGIASRASYQNHRRIILQQVPEISISTNPSKVNSQQQQQQQQQQHPMPIRVQMPIPSSATNVYSLQNGASGGIKFLTSQEVLGNQVAATANFVRPVAFGNNQPAIPSYDTSASSLNQNSRDLQNQPQTLQITAIPNGNLLYPNQLVRVNGQLGWPLNQNALSGSSWFGNNQFWPNNYAVDALGRPLLMNPADRRQFEMPAWFYPLLMIVTLPLVIGALFVPVFLKTIIVLLQILQSLGLLLPLTNAMSLNLLQATGFDTGQNASATHYQLPKT